MLERHGEGGKKRDFGTQRWSRGVHSRVEKEKGFVG